MAPEGLRRGVWWVLFTVAVSVRVAQAAVEPGFLHPDALFQALEPAHWLVHGHGQLPWEFDEGLRSWVWPGMLAGALGLAEGLGLTEATGSAAGVFMARTVVAAFDGWAVVMVANLAARRAQAPARLAVAGLVVVLTSGHPAWVVMGAQPLIVVPATAFLVLACHGTTRKGPWTPRRMFVLGVVLGMVLLLRIHYAPAVLVLGVLGVHFGRREAGRRGLIAGGMGLAIVALASGLLDWWTWGSPWHSTVAYLEFSFTRSTEVFGSMPVDRYWRHLRLAWPWLGVPLLGAALLGVRRAPSLAACILAVVLPHQLVGQRQWHFLHAAALLLPALAALGVFEVLQWLLDRSRIAAVAVAAVVLLGVPAACAHAWLTQSIWKTTWLYHQGGMQAVVRSRSLNRAFVALSAMPRPRAVAQGLLPPPAAAGQALLGHPVPIVHLLAGERLQPPTAGQPPAMLVIPGSPQGAPLPGGATVVWQDRTGAIIARIP